MRAKIRERLRLIARPALARARTLYAPYAGRLRPYFDPFLAPLRTRYERLEPREKTLVQIGLAVSGLFFGYNLVYAPVQSLRQELVERTAARQHELVEVRRLTHNYQQVKLDLAAAEKLTVPQKDFSLFSALEGMLTKSVGVAKIGSITPGEDRRISKDLIQHSVDVTLAGVTLAEVVDTLYGVETLPVPVRVSNLHLKGEALGFEVQMTCVALGKNG